MLIDGVVESVAWEDLRQQLREELGDYSFSMWCSQIQIIQYQNRELRLSVPTELHVKKVLQLYYDTLFKLFQPHFPDLQTIEFECSSEPVQLQLLTSPAAPRFQEEELAGHSKPRPAPPFFERYTFQELVVGEANRLASEACRTVAQTPGGTIFNPLVIHGGTGLGKTHLLHALGSKAYELKTADNICIITSDTLLAEFSRATHSKNLAALFQRYGSYDLVLIDDIQSFVGVRWMEQQFSHLIFKLRQANIQMVVTCDQPIDQLKWLRSDSIERLRVGMAVVVGAPDSKHRLEILRHKNEKGPGFSDEVLEFIAENFSSNVRELEGVLLRLAAYQNTFTTECTLEVAQSILLDLCRDQQQKLTLEMIAHEVAHAFGLSTDHLKSASRLKEYVLPRKVAMYLAYQLLDQNQHSIGAHFNRNYSTVSSSIKSIDALLDLDGDLVDRIDQLRERLLIMKNG